jgi:hypothetical protein
MIRIKKIVFDVLKPHKPAGLEFASAIAEKCPGSVINLNVEAVDQNTESVLLRVEGDSLDFDIISSTILELGGSIHSVDEVEVIHLPDSGTAE